MEGYGTALMRKRWYETFFGTGLRNGKNWGMFLGLIALGFTFLWSGYQKALTTLGGGMATKDFLTRSPTGPFMDFFKGLSGNWGVDYLVVGGEIAIGLGLLFVTLSRLGAIGGFLQMTLFTVALWPIQDTPSTNPIFDTRTFYMALFVMFFFLRPGTFLGGDSILHNVKFIENRPRLKKIMNWIA